MINENDEDGDDFEINMDKFATVQLHGYEWLFNKLNE